MSAVVKGGTRFHQVRSREMSESEPLMTCRNRIVDVRTEGSGRFGINTGGDLKTGLYGVRLEDGMNLDQAQIWNVGTCRSDVKGKDQAGSPCKIEITDAEHRGGAARSRDEGVVMALDRRGCGIQPWHRVNR